MDKCFITKLNVIADSDELLKIGECRFDIRQGRGSASAVNGYGVELVMLEGGVFTINNSNTLTVGGTELNMNPSVSSGVLQIQNKYMLTQWKDNGFYYVAKLEDFKYCNNLKNMIGWFVGDIKDLPTSNTVLTTIDSTGSNQIEGDIKHLGNFRQVLQSIALSGSLYGNIKNVGNKSNAIYIVTNNLDGIVGDVTVFGTYANLSSMRVLGGNLSGDISNIGSVNGVVAMDGTFTWNGRTKDNNLPTIGFINGVDVKMYISNIDEAISDWAKLTPSSTSNNARIRVYGNRTSASDEAFETLKSKLTTLEIKPY